MNKLQDRMDKLRLECEFLLIADERQKALERYKSMLEIQEDPFLLTAKAKLLETLENYPEAVESFEKALVSGGKSEETRREIIRTILDLDPSKAGILKKLAKESIKNIGSQKEYISSGDDIKFNSGEIRDLIKDDNNETLVDRHKEIYSPQKAEVLERSDEYSTEDSIEDAKTEMGSIKSSDSEHYTTMYKEGGSDESDQTEAKSHETGDSEHYTTLYREGKSLNHKEIYGERFGRYKILEKLGEGGMGIVYKVLDPEMDRTVALKIIRETEINEQQARRFLQEVKATARLQHPNIVSIYDFGEFPQHYFTMEYVKGKKLSSIIREGTIKSRKAASILKCICEAIICAHEAKIIHRDLKPGNIMIDESQNIKVMDFGLAKFLEMESSLSQTGMILGTPNYMPPEQAKGKKVDERSDIYAIGAIGYEMITGRPVFQGESVVNILYQVFAEEPLRPRLINLDIDSDLETIILKCLDKSPEKRYQTVKRLLEDIQRYFDGRPILARPPSYPARAVKWVKRNKELSVAITSLILIMVFTFITIIYRWQEQIRYNKALTIISSLQRWDKKLVDYEGEVKPEFEKTEKLSKNFIIYQQWAYFCFRYAHLHPEVKIKYYKEAIQKFEKALSLNPEDYSSLYYMFFIHTDMRNHDKAGEYLKKMFDTTKRLNPDNEFKYVVAGIEKRQEADTAKGSAKTDAQNKAIAYFQQALRYNSVLFCAYNAIGEIYLEQNNNYEAEKNLNHSLELAPNFRRALINRGRLYLERGMVYLSKHNNQAFSELNKAAMDFQNAAGNLQN